MQKSKAHEFICAVRNRAAASNITATFILHSEKSHLMRIGNNSVSLNTSENLTRLDISVFNGRRTGIHTQMGDVLSEGYVQKALDIAVQKAEVASEKDYQPIPDKVEATIYENFQYDKELEALNPTFKADAYGKIIKEAGEQYNISGSWSSGSIELFMVSTANQNEVHHIGTDQDFNVVLKHPEKKWELRQTMGGWKLSDVSAERAIADFKALLPIYENETGVKLEPGEYTVAFGADALAELLMMAGYTGFYGRSYEEKQGWTAQNKIGDKVLGENISVIDEPANDQTYRFGFDLSGKQRTTFPLIENGVLRNLMYDSSTAAKYNHPITGHELGSVSLVMTSGKDDADLFKAVKELDKVIYIPALHYVNIPNYSKGIFTGSSRFNAVLIEKGKVVAPIFSSRVTDSFQNVLGNVIKIACENESIGLSDTYGRRSPVAYSVPRYVVAEKVKITDSADSF